MRIAAVLLDASGEQVLAFEGPGGVPTLPRVEIDHPGTMLAVSIALAQQAVRSSLGDGVRVLRHVREARRADDDELIELEVVSGHSLPENLRWFRAREFDALDRSAIRLVTRSRKSPRRMPWHEPGWYEGASEWIRARVIERIYREDSGFSGARPPRVTLLVERNTDRSSLIYVTCEGRAFIFKADHTLPPHEAVIIERLSRYVPRHVPGLVAIDRAKGWMIQEEVPGRSLRSQDPVALWSRVSSEFGNLQRSMVERVGEFRHAGVRSLSPMEFFAELQDLLIEPSRWGGDDAVVLDESRRRSLEGQLGLIESICQRLEDSVVPRTLVHQDLVDCNVWIHQQNVTFLDWSDSVVGHPFFGFDRLLDGCWTDETRKHAAIESYLGAWREYASASALAAEFRSCQRLRVYYEDVRWKRELEHLPVESPLARRLRRNLVDGLRTMAEHPLREDAA